MNMLIHIVDDEPDIIQLVSIHLKKAGFAVHGFPEGGSFLRSLATERPALVILDLMLPDMDGFEICKVLKTDERYADIPVIMLTARGDEADKVEGLEIGADDYMTKPFSPRELVARVHSVLRRAGNLGGALNVGHGIVIEPDRFEVTVDGVCVNLTTVEFKILYLLASNRGRVLTRERILDHLWGNEKAVLDRTVDVHIKNIRAKLKEAGTIIKNVRGVGYKLQP
ncbi:MAG TPA: response regulator transcription factor [Deltaproteobacteria bacterium]|nr:response regulator transcription factor [Deltaproteobacteria bacterium]